MEPAKLFLPTFKLNPRRKGLSWDRLPEGLVSGQHLMDTIGANNWWTAKAGFTTRTAKQDGQQADSLSWRFVEHQSREYRGGTALLVG